MPLVYLVTLSRADRTSLSTRNAFGKVIEDAFNQAYGAGTVLYWCCSMEPHQGEGFHYHCCVKLLKSRKFSTVRAIMAAQGIHVHFAEGEQGAGYHSAYSYVTKEDPNVRFVSVWLNFNLVKQVN